MNISPAVITSWREIRAIEFLLLILSITCGVIYLLAPLFLGSQMRTYWVIGASIKGLAISPLAAIAFGVLRNRDSRLLTTALLFSSLGDIFLALRNGNYFVFGLLSFLIAHLFFIQLWVCYRPQPFELTGSKKILIGIQLLFLAGMLWWILPVPGLSIPVAIYMCILTTMVITATMANFFSSWVAIGAILFLISDSLIGLSTFKNVIGGKLAGFLIWSTYYLAQYFMTFGFIGEEKR